LLILGVTVTVQLWAHWLQIAIAQAREARNARSEMDRPGPSGMPPSLPSRDLLGDEFRASIVSIGASAYALDALYGSTVIPQAFRDQWPNSRGGPPREAKIREALKVQFSVGPVSTAWVGEFRWLFDLRDAAVHADERPAVTLPHPAGGSTAPEHIRYSVESAERAANFVLSVFRWCVDHPRLNKPEAVKWAAAARTLMRSLELSPATKPPPRA
jgi:hypothetical protein